MNNKNILNKNTENTSSNVINWSIVQNDMKNVIWTDHMMGWTAPHLHYSCFIPENPFFKCN